MKTGLVLEGGAMRGLFSCGVMDEMMARGVRFDGAGGISAGAVFGCNYKSGQPGRALRYNKRYCADWRYASVRSLLLTGDLFGADFCYHRLPNELDPFDWDAFAANPMPFYVVCTDVRTGRPVYHDCVETGDVCLEWVRASASMPIVSRIVELDGGKYLDGAVTDSIPLAFMEQAGFARNIVILTQPADYAKERQSMMGAARLLYRKYPEFLRAFGRRHLVYNSQRDYVRQQEERGDAFVIRPKATLPIRRLTTSPELLQRTYDIGRQTAEDALGRLRAWLAKA